MSVPGIEEEVDRMGIRPGDPAVPVCPFIEMEGGTAVDGQGLG